MLRPDPFGQTLGITLLLLDCDGVMTDGRLHFGAKGEELKVFDVQDGHGIVEWVRAGNYVAIISGRDSEIVSVRAQELGVQIVRQRVKDKVAAASEICGELGLSLGQSAFIGDDIPDLDLIKTVAFGVAVANAVEEVKAAADHVTTREGGRGAVREVVDLILGARTC